MEAETVPRYVEGETAFRADTCEALRAAAARGELGLAAVGRGGYPGAALPEGSVPELRSAGVWDAPESQTWGLGWHRNEGIELAYCHRGHTGFAVAERAETLTRGSLTVTRPWQRHRVGTPRVGPCRLSWLVLDVGTRRPNEPWRWPDWLLLEPGQKRRLTELLSQNERPVWTADADLETGFRRLAATLEAGAELVHIKIAVNEILAALLEMLERRRIPLDRALPSTARTVELFLEELPARVAEPWDVARMARACGLGTTRFSDYCRRITNMAPNAYLRACRVRAAARLLRREPRLSVTEIAGRAGFSTSQYFATVFRRETGVTPRAYRAAPEAAAARERGEP